MRQRMDLPLPSSIESHKSHLTPGIKPIRVGIGSLKDFEESHSNRDKALSDVVRFGKDLGMKDISDIDNFHKFSKGFLHCLGLVASGQNKRGENISFITHHSPYSPDAKKYFEDLKEQLIEFKRICKPGTIDVVIVGGNIVNSKNNNNSEDIYFNSIKAISDQVENVLEFKPLSINGPKTSKGADNIYYNNDERILYFVRDKVNHEIGDFTVDEIEKLRDSQGN